MGLWYDLQVCPSSNGCTLRAIQSHLSRYGTCPLCHFPSFKRVNVPTAVPEARKILKARVLVHYHPCIGSSMVEVVLTLQDLVLPLKDSRSDPPDEVTGWLSELSHSKRCLRRQQHVLSTMCSVNWSVSLSSSVPLKVADLTCVEEILCFLIECQWEENLCEANGTSRTKNVACISLSVSGNHSSRTQAIVLRVPVMEIVESC